jgi:cobalamin biosynthesis protein CobT
MEHLMLGKQGVAKLARALSEERGVLIEFEGSWPVTDGARVRVPSMEGDDAFMIGAVDAMAAVVAAGDKEYLQLASHNALLAQIYCAIESARCMPIFAKDFQGAPAHASLANARWHMLIALGQLDEVSTAVASVGLEAFGTPSKTAKCHELRAAHGALYDQLSLVDSAESSFDLAMRFSKAFEKLSGADDLSSHGVFDQERYDEEDEEDEDGADDVEQEDGKGMGAPSKLGLMNPRAMARRLAELDAFPESMTQNERENLKKQLDEMMAAMEKAEADQKAEGSAGGARWPWSIPQRDGGAAKLIPRYTDHDETRIHDGLGSHDVEAQMAREVAPVVRSMVAGFERVLKTKEQIKWRFERERGAIDTRTLARLQSSPGFRAPFKDKKVFESDAVAVHVLVDLSGSMTEGNKVGVAAQAAMALAMAMKRLDIDCEVSGFSSGPCAEYSRREPDGDSRGRVHEKLVMRKFKSFGKSSLRGLSHIKIDSSAVQNPDGEAVAWAADQLMANPRKRKILMVLSDGEPATEECSCVHLAMDLTSRLAAIKKSGIETIGLGILTSDVKEFYDQSAVVRNLDDLATTALSTLCSILLSGLEKRVA